ncbi:MAG: DUF362 domain-containing protein [Thermoanaerobaculia bacterium]|nr:DUF362 domain-containing protein [Thermoanaerobaculia bacterium]
MRGPRADRASRLTRRELLAAAGGAAGLAATGMLSCAGPREPVVVARAGAYDGSLEPILRDALLEIGFGRGEVRGRRVLLKPNLVEPAPEAPHVNTHPTFVRAAAEVFRSLDAAEVFVAEGQGHVRDSYLVLEQSGFEGMLAEAGLTFVDLNHDDVYAVRNDGGFAGLSHLFLPRTLGRADIVVSLPKLKTHHWVGVTLSMKNLFGVMPGICYGWPKNVLHTVGITPSILDVNRAVRATLALVDGVVAMEGDGPIMGTPVASGLVVAGVNLPAVDATAARLMGFDPFRIPYLARAPEAGLGPIASRAIEQRGERIDSLARPFTLVDHPYTRRFRDAETQ